MRAWLSSKQQLMSKVANMELKYHRFDPPQLNETIGKLLKTLDGRYPLQLHLGTSLRTGMLSWPRKSLRSDNEEEKVITSFCSLYFGQDPSSPSLPNMPFVTEKSLDKSQKDLGRYKGEYPTVNSSLWRSWLLTQVWKVLKTSHLCCSNARAEVNSTGQANHHPVKTSDSDLKPLFNSNVNYIKRFTNW